MIRDVIGPPMRALLLALCVAVPARAELVVQDLVSPGGIPFWLSEDHAVPVVAIEIILKGGGRLDPADRRGATSLMTSLLEEGAGDRDALAWASAVERLASVIGFDSGQDSVQVSVMSLTENLDATVALLADALHRPRLDADAIERVRGQYLSFLSERETDPGELARRAFFRAVLGDHPYAESAEGTPESMAALTRDDLVQAQARALVRGDAVVALAGDIAADRAGQIIDGLLMPLPAEGPPTPARATIADRGGTLIVEVPGPVSTVVFGHAGIGIADPDYPAAQVLMEILGGGTITSRLYRTIREERGLTYSIGAGLSDSDLSDLVAGSFSSGNETVAEALSLLRAEWARMGDGGATEAEVAAAKAQMTGAWPLIFDGNRAIASILAGLKDAGLPPDHATTRNARIAAVTPDDVARVARRLLRPDALMAVVAGQPQGLPAD